MELTDPSTLSDRLPPHSFKMERPTYGGVILELHPGDELGKELPFLFPSLFKATQGTPILDAIRQRLKIGDFSYSEYKVVNSTECLHSSLDIIRMRCFGQNSSSLRKNKSCKSVRHSDNFRRNATKDGLTVTFSYYLVRVTV